MGLTKWQGIWHLLRAWLAGTAFALAPLLLLEDLDFLLRELLFSPKCWPDWASIPISMAFGVAAATWVGLGRRWETEKKGTAPLPQGDRPLFFLPRLELLAQRVTRYTLFLILSPYAVSKVLRTQFRVPYVILDTPLGDVNGYMLAWRFLGYSHGHEIFVALGEWVGPALLLFWRTTTLGACITAVVLANVVAVNFTHDVPVQRFSSCLLALTVYLLLFDGNRLLGFFVFHEPVYPRPQPAAWIQSRWLDASVKVGWMAVALGYALLTIALGDSRPAPMAGAWIVEPSQAKPAIPWRTVYFERGLKDAYPGSIRREAGAKPERFRYEFDTASRHLRITFLNSASPAKSFEGSYEIEDGDRLRLRGVLDEQAVEIQLVRTR